MLRLIGFMVGAMVLANLLGSLPLVGGFFRSFGIVGIWVSALMLSWGIGWYVQWAAGNRALRTKIRNLGAVDTIHAKGKLGSLYLAEGRARKARPLLEAAAAAEPESLEWQYRLASAYLAEGNLEGALAAFEQTVAREPEHAFGSAQMRLAETACRADDGERALQALATFERNHGPSPESAYRRGCAHAALAQSEQATAAWDEVGALAKERARYQKTSSFRWIAATWRARLLGR